MDSIEDILKNSKYDYELINHEKPIHTVQEGADYFGIEIGQTAPTLIIKTDNGFFALLISGDRKRVDFTSVAKILGCKQAKMATREEVKEITGYDVGSVAMVGIALPFILDKQLFRYPYVYGGSGQDVRTLKIAPTALQHLNQVVAFMGE